MEYSVGICSEVGTYAGGFFVRPNKIDYAKSLAMFLQFWENPVGLILVGVIFILFLILLYWALRKDKQDALLVSSSSSSSSSNLHNVFRRALLDH